VDFKRAWMKLSLAANLVLNWVCPPVLSFPERLQPITAAAMCTVVINVFSNLVHLMLSFSISYPYSAFNAEFQYFIPLLDKVLDVT
jgi:hypothetical protein